MLEVIRNRFPGISCAYTDETGKVMVQCYGLSDVEQNIPVVADTMFPAASMSKFVTALCIIKMQELTLVDIDAPVNQYLRQWKLRGLHGYESNATIKAILSHTAGVVDGENGFYGLRRGDPEISLMDILEGRTFYHNRPVRAEKPQGVAFEYSDAGYCVLQLLMEEITGKSFPEALRELIFEPLQLHNTFYATNGNLAKLEHSRAMASGYDGDGLPMPGKFLPCPDLAAAGLWTTPRELLMIAKAFIAAYNGKSEFLRESSAKEMAAPLAQFPWSGLGIFVCDDGFLMTQGWAENGQSMMKFNCHTGQISVVMTNRNPEMDQAESGVELLVNQNLHLTHI